MLMGCWLVLAIRWCARFTFLDLGLTRVSRHFVFNKIVRLRGCSSLFDVLDELTKPPDSRMKDLAAHPPAFLKGVPTTHI